MQVKEQADGLDEQRAMVNGAWSSIQREWALDLNMKKEQRIQAFMDEFREYCVLLRQEQLAGRKGNIRYITYSMLRTAWLEEHPVYWVEAADALWVLDPKPVQSVYDASWVYGYWTELRGHLLTEAQAQQVALSELVLEQIMLGAAVHIHAMLVSLIRLALKRAAVLPEFQQLDREETFEIRVGEYMDWSVCVYKEEHRLLDSSLVRDWLEEEQEHAYSYQALTSVQLPGGDYSHFDFRYTAFRQIGMEGGRLHACILVGTVWQESQLDETDFSYSLINGADFSGCSMQGAVLEGVMGNAGFGEENWDGEPLGYAGVNFTGTNLQKASFRGAELQGAVFEAAVLHKASFVGTNLTNACFVGADLAGASFAGAMVTSADFTGAKLQGVSFTDEQRSDSRGIPIGEGKWLL